MVSKQKAKENLIGEEIFSHSLDQNQRNTYIYIYIYITHIYINTYTHNQHSLECSTVLSLFRNAKTDPLQVQQQQEQHYKFTTTCKLITAKMNYENKKV